MTRMRVRAGLAAVLLVVGATAAQAQVFTPTYMSPQQSSDMGVYLSDGPGDFAIEGVWRRDFGTYDLGFRGGIADYGDVLFLLGAEFRNPLRVAEAPVVMAVTGGVQGAIGDVSAVGLQGGLTVGVEIAEAAFTFVPYLHPRLALIRSFGGDDFDFDPLADIGFDFVLPQNITIRFGVGLGGPTASWGLGFAWR